MIVMDVLESLLAEATALTSRSNSPFECSSLTDPDLPSNFKGGGGDVLVDGGLQLATSNGDTKFCFKALTAQIIREPAKAGFCFSTYVFFPLYVVTDLPVDFWNCKTFGEKYILTFCESKGFKSKSVI